jgi:hypothetical protein
MVEAHMSTTRTDVSLFDRVLLRRTHDDAVPSNGAVGPATPNRHRNSNHDWDFPFASPGRFKPRTIKPNTERRMPWVDMDAVDDVRIEPRLRAFGGDLAGVSRARARVRRRRRRGLDRRPCPRA